MYCILFSIKLSAFDHMRQFFNGMLVLVVLLSAYSASAQNTPVNKKDTSGTKTQHTVTKTVVFTRTLTDNASDEMFRFDDYVKKNLKPIPGVHGSVMVSFTAEKDGSITNVRVVKSLNSKADQEALRLVKAYPRWEPDMQDGQPVSSILTLPIDFK